MPERLSRHCRCADEQRPPPGGGIALASILGLVGGVLALLVWILSGAWVWTLLTWFVAGPAMLCIWLFRETAADAARTPGCDVRGCQFRLWPSSFNGAVNV